MEPDVVTTVGAERQTLDLMLCVYYCAEHCSCSNFHVERRLEPKYIASLRRTRNTSRSESSLEYEIAIQSFALPICCRGRTATNEDMLESPIPKTVVIVKLNVELVLDIIYKC